MKLVKQLENGKLAWFDANGYREATAQEIDERNARIAAAKAKQEANKRKTEIKQEIAICKDLLKKTDYKQAKWLDGALSEEEYAPDREKRQEWRNKINALEEELKSLEG